MHKIAEVDSAELLQISKSCKALVKQGEENVKAQVKLQEAVDKIVAAQVKQGEVLDKIFLDTTAVREQGVAAATARDALVAQGRVAATATVETNRLLGEILAATKLNQPPSLKAIEASLVAIDTATAATAVSTAAFAATGVIMEASLAAIDLSTAASALSAASVAVSNLANGVTLTKIDGHVSSTASSTASIDATVKSTNAHVVTIDATTKATQISASSIVTSSNSCATNTAAMSATLLITNVKLTSIGVDLEWQAQIYNNVVGIAATQNKIVGLLTVGDLGTVVTQLKLIKDSLRDSDLADANRVVGYQQLLHKLVASVTRPVPTTTGSLFVVGGDIAWHTAQDPEGNLRHVLPVKTF
jgi:hypothetical protein